ncbi:MAG: cyclic nucleotide-binding domain-containing protein [Ignavibacteriae bacterium]|nr:cyclic nucleotide-binding domain-containing protein [Ignavibacteriota bacterium]
MENLENIVSEHPFLKGLDPQYIQLVSGCASNVRFEAGQYLFREDEEANWFYIIRQGKVAVEAYAAERGAVIIDTVEEGDVLGWSWLIPPYNWHFDARAIELTRAIALDGKCLRNKCEHDHNLGYELLKRFAHIIEQRLEATRIRLLDLYGNGK